MTRLRQGVVAVSLGALLLGIGVTASATSSDACQKLYTSNTIANLQKYTDCRDDRIDASLKRIEDKLNSNPATPSPTPTVEPSSPTSTPEPSSPAPTPSPTTPPGFPDATNTGVKDIAALKRVPEDVSSGKGWHVDPRGWVSIDDTGAIFEGYRTKLNLNVYGSSATIRGNLLESTGPDYIIALRHANKVTVDHNMIRGTAVKPCDNGIRDIYGDSDEVQILANDISLCSSGINHFNNGGLIKDNYIHDLGVECNFSDLDCGHFNGIQLEAGFGPLMTIDHNTILNPAQATDAIMLAADDGAQTNRNITDNLIGGGGFTFYGSGWSGATATNIKFTGNRFTTRYFPNGGSLGPVAHWQGSQAGNVWSNNAWADGPKAGQPVNP